MDVAFDLAGEIELSTGEIILIFATLAAMALALPLAAGGVAVVLYRRRTLWHRRSRRDATILFFKVFAVTLVAQIAIVALIGWIQELIG